MSLTGNGLGIGVTSVCRLHIRPLPMVAMRGAETMKEPMHSLDEEHAERLLGSFEAGFHLYREIIKFAVF